MANFGGFLQALGQAFGGYGQDQQNRFARDQSTQRLGLERRSADDAHTNAMLERATNYPFASSATANPPSASGAGSGAPGGDLFPRASVDVPGYGTIDPFGKYRLQLRLDAAKRRMETDEKVRESELTGATAEHQTHASLNQREIGTPRLGDATYADALGQVEAKKALATLPTQIRLEVLRGNISLGNALQLQAGQQKNALQLQGNQQQFEQGQQGRQFQYNADQAAKQLTGGFVNESALTNQRARGTFLGKFLAPDASTVAPSTAANLPKLSGEQVIRAAREPMYRQFLEDQGYQLSPTTPNTSGRP